MMNSPLRAMPCQKNIQIERVAYDGKIGKQKISTGKNLGKNIMWLKGIHYLAS
jgi:hypothetical protein